MYFSFFMGTPHILIAIGCMKKMLMAREMAIKTAKGTKVRIVFSDVSLWLLTSL